MKRTTITAAAVAICLVSQPALASFAIGGGYAGQNSPGNESAAVISRFAQENTDHYYYLSLLEHTDAPFSFSAVHLNTADGYTRLQVRFTTKRGMFITAGQTRIRVNQASASDTLTGSIIGVGYSISSPVGVTEVYTARDSALDEDHVFGARQTLKMGSKLYIDLGYRRHKNHYDEIRAGLLWRY